MATKIASEALKLFGPPQLIDGEVCSAYEALHERVWLSLEPVDILEEIWVRDFVDLTWEVLRGRRLKSSLMAASAFKGLQKVLSRFSFEGVSTTRGRLGRSETKRHRASQSHARIRWLDRRYGHGPDLL